jgi:L-amino acid N-acyltransferase YncA
LKRFSYKNQELKYSKKITDENNPYFVAKVEDKIVGVMGVKDNDEAISYQKQIKSMYVSSKFQNQGIGENLFQTMFSEMKNRHVNNFMLWCISANSQDRNFYEKRV